MIIDGLDHINIRTRDLERCSKFYTEVLGFELGDRPPFPFPGAWLYCNGRPVIHLIATDQETDSSLSPVDHFAVAARGFDDTIARLEEAGAEHQVRDVPGRAIRQVFVQDPDGVFVELNFSHPTDQKAGAAPTGQ